ncbi:hypothetical protein O6P43_020307 [Quillaja saponaria]|uniref:Uncharacterized protein n=1 Tax=Quillaja saponaria TaxID=32244 RepID=A0AAD7PM53_QUISA|nr:hypothetical protein O6P43_020307 [Quillaja saponaria]
MSYVDNEEKQDYVADNKKKQDHVFDNQRKQYDVNQTRAEKPCGLVYTDMHMAIMHVPDRNVHAKGALMQDPPHERCCTIL